MIFVLKITLEPIICILVGHAAALKIVNPYNAQMLLYCKEVAKPCANFLNVNVYCVKPNKMYLI